MRAKKGGRVDGLQLAPQRGGTVVGAVLHAPRTACVKSLTDRLPRCTTCPWKCGRLRDLPPPTPTNLGTLTIALLCAAFKVDGG